MNCRQQLLQKTIRCLRMLQCLVFRRRGKLTGHVVESRMHCCGSYVTETAARQSQPLLYSRPSSTGPHRHNAAIMLATVFNYRLALTLAHSMETKKLTCSVNVYLEYPSDLCKPSYIMVSYKISFYRWTGQLHCKPPTSDIIVSYH